MLKQKKTYSDVLPLEARSIGHVYHARPRKHTWAHFLRAICRRDCDASPRRAGHFARRLRAHVSRAARGEAR
jgi:hypothetical protein